MNSKTSINIFWFRRDLRLEDNHALCQALKGSLPVLPIFIFDTNILDKLSDRFDRRVDFIHQRLQDLDNTLKKTGRSLHIFHGTAASVFSQLIQKYNISTVFINRDYEPFALQRDGRIEELLTQNKIGIQSFKDQVIFEKDDVLKADGTPYMVYTPYRKIWEQHLVADNLRHYPSEKHLHNLYKSQNRQHISLDQLGFQKTDLIFKAHQIDEEIISRYERHRDIPSIDGTTRLSVHLRFGTVSIRRLVRKALQLNDTWLGELIWREFFMMILSQFPHVIDRPFRAKYIHFPWRNDRQELSRWKAGQTGYPLVDAGMRELNASGFMHNRVRMVTASFLTKHLLIDYRLGEDYFAEKLLDFDLAANNGNWQWAAGCGCDAAPYFRIFNPYTQAQKYDSQNVYIQKWVPEFQDSSYVKPIIEHRSARERALAAYNSIR